MTPELRITVLMENTAREGLEAEHGLSFFLEYRGRRFLLDAGSSGRFADNAQKLGVDLDGVELAALSHGHYDHADGLRAFFALNDRAPVYIRPQAGEAYYSKSGGSPRFVGIHREIWEGFRDRFVPVDGLYPLCPGAWLAPETVRGGPFASREPNLLRKVGEDRFLPDDFSHEQSLVLDTKEGLVIFNSCSHGGADVIIREAEAAFPGKQIYGLIGGFHLFRSEDQEVRELADRIRKTGIRRICTGHCTGERAMEILKEELGDMAEQIYTGFEIEV